jgi:hypothetical protein
MKLRYVPALSILVVAGCSKIHEQRSFTLEPGAGNTLAITAPLSEQKVKVVVTSDQPVNVWVLLERNLPAGGRGDRGDWNPDTMTTGVLAKEKNTASVTLEATVPAKEPYQIFVNNPNSKPASVTVKVDSQ